MNFKYNGDQKDLIIFGYDFSKGFADVDDIHFQEKLSNMPDFKAINDIEGETALTTKDLKLMLNEKGINYKVNDSKPTLQKLLDEANDKITTD